MFATCFPPKAARTTLGPGLELTLLESESFPLSAAAAGVGGEGPRCQGTGCGQSLLAGRPGSGRCPGLTQAGRSLRPPTRSRTRNFKLAGELDLVFQAPAGRVMGQFSYSKAVPQTGPARVRVQGVGRGREDRRDIVLLYLGSDGTRRPPSALTPPSAGSEPGTQTCLGPYLMLMTGWDSLRAGSESSLLRGD